MSAVRKVRARRLAATPVGLLLLVAVLVALVGQALTVPAVARLAGLPAVQPLDYHRQVSTFAALTDSFVRRALGLPPLRAAAVGTPDRQPGTVPGDAVGQDGVSADAPVTARHAFSNDDFDRAYVVRGLPFTASTDTAGQSRQPGEPASCSTTGGTAWYRYTAVRDRTLFADTFGTSYADSLGIYTGSSVGALQQVGCASSATGDAQTGFQARRGTTYWFQIGGTVGSGRLLFHLLPIGTTRQVRSGVEYTFALSGNGRYVAFPGYPTGPEPGARPCHVQKWCAALYLADLRTGRVRILLSLHPGVAAPDNDSVSAEPSLNGVTISTDGRYVGFHSDDSELAPDDSNNALDVYVFDRVSGAVERDSVASDGSGAHVDPLNNSRTGACGYSGGPIGSFTPSLSGDGRFVAFESYADNLGSGPDSAGCPDMFLHDRLTGRTEQVSLGSDGSPLAQGGQVFTPSYVSADGRFVAFQSSSGVRLYDRHARASRAVPGTAEVERSVLSADGSHLAFLYRVDSQTAGVSQEGLAIVDLRSNRVSRLGGGASGEPSSANLVADEETPPGLSVSATGRYVALGSNEADLVPGDTNGVQDVFVFDTLAQTRVRVSMTSTGEQYPTGSATPSISADGRTVAFLQLGSTYGGVGLAPAALLVHQSVRAGAP